MRVLMLHSNEDDSHKPSSSFNQVLANQRSCFFLKFPEVAFLEKLGFEMADNLPLDGKPFASYVMQLDTFGKCGF